MSAVITAAVAVFLTFLLHEGAHWATGELLGNEMAMTLNVAYPISRAYIAPWHATVVAAAGPLVTLIQAVVAYAISVRRKSTAAYLFLLAAVVMRVLALGVNVIARPQDEAKVSLALGLGPLALPLVMCGVLIALAGSASRRNGYSRRFNAISTVAMIVFSSVIILTS
jgi:hypothetical protein